MHFEIEKRALSKVSRRTFMTGLAGLSLLSCSQARAAANFANFSFVYVTDVHLALGVPDNAFKLLQESQLFLQDIIKGINALKPDFVIFGGDQVETVGKNDGNWQFFIDIVQGLASPWYFVLGEQDVSGKVAVDKMKEFGPDFKGRGLNNTEAYWSCDPLPNVHLIGLDTSEANNTGGEISKEQLDWLKQDLLANRNKFTIVAAHHPLLPPPPYDGGPPLDAYILANGSDVREVIGRSTDVRMVLSGHLYMNKVQIERDVYHISCAGLNVYPCQYKYFKVSKEAMIMESFEVPLPKLIKKGQVQLAESALASKINRRKPEAIIGLCEGNPEDQNALLSLSPTKSVRELSKKQLKEDQQRREAELEKQAEETGKSKLKSKDKSKERKTTEDKNSRKKNDESEKKNRDKKSSSEPKKPVNEKPESDEQLLKQNTDSRSETDESSVNSQASEKAEPKKPVAEPDLGGEASQKNKTEKGKKTK